MRYWPLVAYALLYTALLAAMRVRHDFAMTEPLFILAIVGVGFTALSWWSTRDVVPRDIRVKAPEPEMRTVFALLVMVAAFITWGLPAVRAASEGPASESVVLVIKLIAFVALPMAVFRRRWAYRLRDFVDVGRGFRGQWRPLIALSIAVTMLQLVFGRAPAEMSALSVPPWALAIALCVSFVWLFLEVGVVEEFFFRTLLQSRLAAWSRSELLGLVAMALLFGLAHAPGLYLRPELTGEPVGSDPSLLMAVGYSIVMTSVTGFYLGVLWLRTRNLLLIAVVHAMNDLLPFTADHLRSWF
jgi:membrane protease YdiL (CAAX protease family)